MFNIAVTSCEVREREAGVTIVTELGMYFIYFYL